MAFKKHKEKFGDTSSGFLPIAIGGEVFALDYDADIKSTTKTVYSKTINDLNPNTNYKLVIYPLFEEENINKKLSEIITFNTNDNKFRGST